MSASDVSADSFGDEIDRVCDRFEAEWRSGGQPRIELYVAEVPEPARPELIRELLKLDIYYRRDRGDTIAPDDYKPQFPEHADLIDKLLESEVPPQRAAGIARTDRPPVEQLTAEFGSNARRALEQTAKGRTGHSLHSAGHRYKILRPHAEGGLGEVLVALDQELRREVALKRIRNSSGTNTVDAPGSCGKP